MQPERKNLKPQFEQTPKGLLVRAPAKINLSLLIGEKRPDGFHNLETIMAKINFYDELLFTQSDNPGLELTCNGPQWAPLGSENLIVKAAELFYKSIDKKPRIKISLNKNIPAASGLGGASSDAAATVMALNKIENNPLTDQKMHGICSCLGSDVPFFLGSPLAFCSGKGEKIQKIPKKFTFSALLMLPGISSSTKEVYGQFQQDLLRFFELSKKIKAFLDQNRLDLITNLCANMLEKPCFKINNRLKHVKDAVSKICAKPVCLSGSGSSMFSVLTDADFQNAEITQSRIKDNLACECFVVSYNQW